MDLENLAQSESLIRLVLNIFKNDVQHRLDQNTSISAFAADYESHIRNVHPTQGISIKRPSNWSDLLLIASELPIDDAFSQLLRCIRNSPDTGAAVAEEDWLHLLHLDNQRDLPRLQRLQSALPAALPAALRSDEFVQCLQEVSGSSGFDGDGDAEADSHRVLRELIKSSPDWFEHIILTAIVDEENGADLLSIVAPFGAVFDSELPTLRKQLDNIVDSSEFQDASKAVIGHSNHWFCRNGLNFNPDTCRLEPTANQESPSPSRYPLLSNNENELRGWQLRDYQLELAEPALLGRNSIVIAPTGSGKTLVAVYVTLQLLKTKPQAKVAFLASSKKLVDQQYQVFRSVLPPPWANRVLPISGGAENTNLQISQALKRNSVLILSTEILLNELKRDTACLDGQGLSVFHLIIIDECHNCDKKHPTRQVMLRYLQLKLRPDQSEVKEDPQKIRLPQILGLTASPGTGKASRPEDANEHLIKLCANLDCPYPITVQRCLASLEKEISDADCQMHSVSDKPSSEDIFIKLLNELMDSGEELLRHHLNSLQQWDSKALHVTSLSSRGTPAYTGYCDQVKYNIHNVTNKETSKNILACSRYLGVYNETNMIAQFYNPRSALHYLEKELRITDELAKPPASEAECRLRQHLNDLIGPISRFCNTDEGLSSPPLDKLVELLRERFSAKPDSRAIVFVQQKFYARLIADFLNEVIDSLGLPATYVTGTTSGEAAGSTNTAEQLARIKDFKSGRYKVIACTGAEEGLDIPACNLVVRYCHLTNEVNMVQTKGRCRAKDSACHAIIAEAQESLRQKERTNQCRDIMMKQSVECVTGLQTRDLEVKILEYQTEMLNKEENGATGGGHNGSNVPESDHDILCGKCQTQLSHSSQLRLICKIHRIVVDVEMFTDGRLRGESGGEVKEVPGMEMIGVNLVCNSCGFKVAKIVRYGRLYFPLLKVEYVMFRRSVTEVAG